MYFETIPTITTSRSLSKLARGIQGDQVYFLPKKYVHPSSCSDKYQKLLKSATFFQLASCFIPLVRLLRSQVIQIRCTFDADPCLICVLCIQHVAIFFVLLYFYALCYFAFLFTFTFDVNNCASFLGILSTLSLRIFHKQSESFENPFGKTSIPIGGRQQSHSISINIGCVTQFLTSRNFWKCTNFTNFPPSLHSAVSWPSQTVNYMMGRGLIFKPLNNDFRCPI